VLVIQAGRDHVVPLEPVSPRFFHGLVSLRRVSVLMRCCNLRVFYFHAY
jgi:hypothetical protein